MSADRLRYLSVCSGIEAATCAWHPLGWKPWAFSEIEPFPASVLAQHYPNVPNFGDMTKFKEWPDAAIDLLVGGTPCQSFSVAGLRKGLDDPRGNLMLTYLAIADKYRPRWLVWENVPGVLSSGSGRDFGTFLGGLGQLGYGFAYRVLDAQFVRVESHARAVPQRRRRVFVVGYLGDWRRAAAVLLERESLQGHPAPRRDAGKGVTGTIEASVARSRGAGAAHGGIVDIAHPLRAQMNASHRADSDTYVPAYSLCLNGGGMGRQDSETETLIPTIGGGFDVARSLRAEGFDAGEDGTGRGTPLVPIAFSAKDYGADAGDVSPTLRAGGFTNSHANGGVMPAIAFDARQSDVIQYGEKSGPLDTDGGFSIGIQSGMQVRRLTPLECERLQGFPDGYTSVPHNGKPAADGPRYKALGNSMAVNCMSWIGQRIALVESLTKIERAA